MIVIQARQSSTRWPQKWKTQICGMPMIDMVYEACAQTNIRPIVIAMPDGDRELFDHCQKAGYHALSVKCPENDLIQRFITVMQVMRVERCLRITADCPFHMPQEMEWVWRHGQGVDFCTNGWPEERTTIDGVDCETYSLRLLRWMNRTVTGGNREHLPLHIYTYGMPRGFSMASLHWPIDLSKIKTSIDTKEDYERMGKDGLI